MDSAQKRRNLLSFAYVSFLALWLLSTIAFIAVLHAGNELFFVRRDGLPYVSDFLNCYSAGKIACSPERYKAYDPEVQLKWTNSLISPERLERPFYLQYPPYFFTAMMPLSPFPIGAAFWLWCMTTFFIGGACLLLLLRQTSPLTRRERWLFLLGVTASVASWLTFRQGQLSWLMVGFVAIYFWSLLRDRDIICGVMLALTSIKLQYVPFLATPLLAAKRWKALLVAVLAEAALVVAGGLTVGWENVANYPSVLRHAETTAGFAGVGADKMVNLRGAAALLSPGLPAIWASAVSVVVGLILALWISWKGWRCGPAARKMALSLVVAVCLFASPHAHTHDMLLLATSAALTLPCLDLFALARTTVGALRVWCVLFVIAPVLGWALYLSADLWTAARIQPFALFNLCLLACGLWRFRTVCARVDGNASGS